MKILGPPICILAGLLLAGPSQAQNLDTTSEVCNKRRECASLVYQGFTYPYQRPAGSYLYIDGGVYPYVTVTSALLGNSTVRLPNNRVVTAAKLLQSLELQASGDHQLVPVIGYGSNPAPSQLARKFRGASLESGIVIPVMKGRLKDFDVVWTPVFVRYGSMPATVTPSKGTTVEVWVTWLDEKAVEVLDETERSNLAERPLYVQTTLEGAEYQFDGPDPKGMTLYVSCFGALMIDGQPLAVASIPAEGRTFPVASSSQALEAIIPHINWEGDVLDLLYENVTSPESRAARSTLLVPYGRFPAVSGAQGLEACKASRAGAQIPY